MKYLIFSIHPAYLSPVLFPANIRHVHMAHDVGFPVRSGGWVEIEDGVVVTYGQAHSIDKAPHEDDAGIICDHLMGE